VAGTGVDSGVGRTYEEDTCAGPGVDEGDGVSAGAGAVAVDAGFGCAGALPAIVGLVTPGLLALGLGLGAPAADVDFV